MTDINLANKLYNFYINIDDNMIKNTNEKVRININKKSQWQRSSGGNY